MRPKTKVKPEINVTPLVDVVLVLLIIFMVVTPEMNNQEAVDLPAILFPDPESKTKATPLEISFAKDGRILLDKEVLPEEGLEERLSSIRKSDPKRSVVLRADVGIPYGQVRKLYGICERLGFPGVALAVSEKQPAATRASL